MGKTLILAAFALIATAAVAQDAPEAASDAALAPTTPAEPSAEMKALADSCSARKFETMVVVDGSGRGKRVKICGEPGQTDADWLVTLKDSSRKVAADGTMAQAVKDQILAALKVEIGKLESTASTPPAAPQIMAIELANTPVSAPEATPQYSSVPPLPAPKPRNAALAANASKTAVAPVARPRLTIRCALPRQSFGDCARLERETQLQIRADERLAGGVSVRFLRGGDERAEIDLGPLGKGDSTREKLPGRVCSGVLRGKVELQILTKGQVAETLGPYTLYCGS